MKKEGDHDYSYPYNHEIYSLFWAERILREHEESLPDELVDALEIIIERYKDLEEVLIEKERNSQQELP